MAEVVTLDPRYFCGLVYAAVDDVVGNSVAMVLDGLDVTIKARLQVQRARTGNGEHDVATFGHQLQPPGRNVVPGLVKRLSHIAQALVRAAGRHVGVITDHRDAGS